MEENKSNSSNLSDFISGLQKAKAEILKSEQTLKDKPKKAEDYLICKNGIVAETDQSPLKKGRTIIKGA